MPLPDVSGALMLFLLDMAENLLVLMMALRTLSVRIRPFRLGFSAFFGAALAYEAKCAALPRRMQIFLWLPTAWVMMRIAGTGKRSAGRMLEEAAVLFACAGCLGGVILSFYGATGSLWTAHVIGAGASAAIFVGVFSLKRKRGSVSRVQVMCTDGENELCLHGIVDSGNTLRDYLTGLPVIVAGPAYEEKMCAQGFRIIFADTAGGREMMRLIVPRQIRLASGGRCVGVRAALAFSPGLRHDAAALVPAALLEET